MSLRNLKNKYDRKVLETFDLIGCYFIDLFYNDLFLKSKHAFTTGHSKSLTETYRSHIIWFMRGIDEKPKNYIEVMKKLLDYYNAATKTITSTLSELEHKILCQFIPAEYYQDFTNANKEKVLHDIIIRAVNQLGELTLEPATLGKIIDDHMNQGNVQLMQEKMTDIFIVLREEYYSKFVNEISKASGNKTVSIEQFKKLKGEYAEEIKRRIAVESERDRAVQLLQVSLQKISELESALSGHNNENYTMGKETARIKTPVRLAPQVHSPQVHSPQVHSPQVHSPQVHSPQLKSPQVVLKPSKLLSPTVQKTADNADNVRTDNVRTDTARTDTARNVHSTDIPSTPGRDDTNVGLKRSDLKQGASKSDVATEQQHSVDSSEDSSEGSSSEDSEELHKRQRKKLIDKRQSETLLGLEDDDPGFGN